MAQLPWRFQGTLEPELQPDEKVKETNYNERSIEMKTTHGVESKARVRAGRKSKVNKLAVLALLLAATPLASRASDHSDQYQIGVFSSTGQLSDGSYSSWNGSNSRSYSAAHNIHYIRTSEGMFAIEAPVSVAASMITGMATGGFAPTVHKEWFMDQLHEGDKILFRANCNKHNNCTFWLPNPDHEGREIRTLGYYRADNARSNTQQLCGKGKLAPDVEAQVCSAPPTPTAAAAAPQPASNVKYDKKW